MRMWMVEPKCMCRKHLLGEHVELHMLVGSIKKNRSISGFLVKGLLEPQNIKQRHEELVCEMKRRKYNHKSKLPEYHTDIVGAVNKNNSIKELMNRCEECRSRFLKKRGK